ncbi:tRNA lysidine(34) synthetase TilS [Sediminicurvatus halobius]|uniref:tRNA(Ile)-lysidine synthase n=1 Tax=Sediminicurvatus halobius TaxID=2182432 RepID=A0A2U2N4B0_9GAMM|nr:tRNA lysidine(34) synthetase TilS [Spiribacter halobius]PWG63923.1 tRNA lysidine(34) synthetase TilS [Spiribacter halobius]UEX76336.1 tRNA lysidine(34) synthetase TilS [Spiribacter halobius]
MPSLTPADLRAALPAGLGSLAVAFSGGRDSHVLLHLAVAAGLRVRALHVHHGLQAQADAWARHCETVAGDLGVPLTVLPVRVVPAGEGLEAAARAARYRALARALAVGEHLATAHHADDQAETLLLRVLRGTGPDGLAGIQPQRALGAGTLLRPLLAVPRSAIAAYADARALAWIEDPANRDPRHDRSWLRHRIMPELAGRWSDVPQRLARLARESAEARALRDGLLDEVLRGMAGEPPGPLPVAALAARPEREVRALVRRWLARDGRRPPPAARLADGLAALLGAAADRAPELVWADGRVGRHAGELYRLPLDWPVPTPRPVAPPPATSVWDGVGGIRWRSVTGAGLEPARLPGELLARPPAAGDRFQPPGRKRRALKHWLREAGVPLWWRARLPVILTAEGELIAVAGLAVAEGWQAGPGSAGWWPDWQPQPPQPAGDAAVLRRSPGRP